MRNLFWFFLFTCTWHVASAQRAYFIYLQSENGSPFYVKMGEKIMSSSAQGYLVIPSLADSTHALSLGFPATGSEMKYRIALNGKDKGFLVKNFDFGWGLSDLQQESIIKPLASEGRMSGSYRVRNDDFSILLSRAAKDSSLLIVPVAAREDVAVIEPTPAKKPVVLVEEKKLEPKPDTVTTETVVVQEPKPDSLIASRQEPLKDSLTAAPLHSDSLAIVQDKKEEPPVEEKKTEDVKIITAPVEDKKEEQAIPYQKSVVRKYSESSTSEGFGLVFFDETPSGIDTIRLLIPNPPVLLRQDDTVQQDQRFLDIGEVNAGKKTEQPNKKTEEADKKTEKKPVATSTCKEVAGNSDFMKLRRYMAAESTDEAMVDEAKKFFRTRCFTTEQVKNLGALFLSSAGKYLFYDAAYFHVTDKENFPSLASEIRDDYYLKRFKALIGE